VYKSQGLKQEAKNKYCGCYYCYYYYGITAQIKSKLPGLCLSLILIYANELM